MDRVLKTSRLVLRPWTAEDVPDLVEGLGSFETARWLALIPHPYTPECAMRWVQYCLGLGAGDYEFAVEQAETGKVIGGTSLSRISRTHRAAGGGIWINEQFHGQGFGSEAFGERIRFAFQELELRRLENGYFPGNEASEKLQRRFGYRHEGVRRKALFCLADGEFKDEILMGLLKEEWIA